VIFQKLPINTFENNARVSPRNSMTRTYGGKSLDDSTIIGKIGRKYPTFYFTLEFGTDNKWKMGKNQ
jgi:hypothetical protein